MTVPQKRTCVSRGWKAPATGGPDSKSLTPEQRAVDRLAWLTISQELGHEREAVTATYLGRGRRR